MSPPADHSHSVRRVLLPSGKTIEVVYFEDRAGHEVSPPPPDVLAPGRDEDLHRCGSCACDLVYPLDWSEAGPVHWQVTLRCPNCEAVRDGVFASAVVERFDAELDHGTESLISDLRRLMHANMEEDVERFCAALQAGHIVPADF